MLCTPVSYDAVLIMPPPPPPQKKKKKKKKNSFYHSAKLEELLHLSAYKYCAKLHQLHSHAK